MRTFQLYLFLILAFFYACKKDIGKLNYGDYPNQIGQLISNNCATSGCHNTQSYSAAGGLNLQTWSSLFKGSTNGSAVIPFNSKFSSLCYFINTYTELGAQNLPSMPLNKKPLSFNDVKMIKTWIDNGAPDVNGNIMWANHPVKKKLYAINQGCSVVTVFDSDTQLPIRYIQVGTKGGNDSPHQLKISADGKFWYVVFVNNNIIQKFSAENDQLIENIPLTPAAAGTGLVDALNWNTLVLSNDGKRAYAVSWQENGAIAAVDLEQKKLIHFMSFVYFPHGIALSAKQDKIYVTAQTGNYFMEIDTAFTYRNNISLENSVLPSQNSILDAHDIILSPNQPELWITCQKSNEVRVYNTISKTVTNIIPTGLFPQEIVYSKSRDEYFITCTNDTLESNSWGSVQRINAKDKHDFNKIKCGYQPHGIVVDENTKLIYVLSRNQSSKGPPPHHTSQCAGRNGFVNFINLNTFSLKKEKFEMSVDPYFISTQP